MILTPEQQTSFSSYATYTCTMLHADTFYDQVGSDIQQIGKGPAWIGILPITELQTVQCT